MGSGTERELVIAIWKNTWARAAARVFLAAGLEVNEALNGNFEVVVLYFDVCGEVREATWRCVSFLYIF